MHVRERALSVLVCAPADTLFVGARAGAATVVLLLILLGTATRARTRTGTGRRRRVAAAAIVARNEHVQNQERSLRKEIVWLKRLAHLGLKLFPGNEGKRSIGLQLAARVAPFLLSQRGSPRLQRGRIACRPSVSTRARRHPRRKREAEHPLRLLLRHRGFTTAVVITFAPQSAPD